jgi:hypothetical protein
MRLEARHALERSKVRYLGPGFDEIRFLMRDGTEEVACGVSLEALDEGGNGGSE